MNYLSVNRAKSVSENNKNHEIDWCKKRINSFKDAYKQYMEKRGNKHNTKPHFYKQIIDLERQIKERGGVPDDHDWIKRD